MSIPDMPTPDTSSHSKPVPHDRPCARKGRRRFSSVQNLSLFLGLLAVVAFFRFWNIGDKPLHHDESLFAYYAFQVSETGNYDAGGYAERYGEAPLGSTRPTHHPLLHGPLLIEWTGGLLWLTNKLGIDDHREDGIIRCLPALSLLSMLPLVFAFGSAFPRGGRWFTVLLLSVSPALWYYSRFCRNDLLFAAVSLSCVLCWTRALMAMSAETGRLSPLRFVTADFWLLAAIITTALMVAIKENAVFVVFSGLTFAVLWLALHPRDMRSWASRLFVRGRFFVWVCGAALGWLLLEAVYTNFFLWDTSFSQMYGDAFHYWSGQHREHRLYGEFHYYLLRLLLYEPFSMLMIPALAILVLIKYRNAVTMSLGLMFFFLALAIGRFFIGFAPESGQPLALNNVLHMTSPFHLALAVLVAWFTLAASAFLIKRRQFFGAWLCWWTGLSFLQYSYAGEKVPWLSVHIVLPLLLTTGYLAGLCWERSRDLSHLPHLRRRDLLTALCLLAVGLNFFQGYRLNFFNAENPAEILVYNHTQSAFRDFAHRMRADAKVDKSLPPRALVQGEPTWPLLWYMRGTHYVFSGPDALPEEYIQMQYIACDESYLDAFPVLREQFDIRQVDFRRHWFPERLHLMQPIRNALLDKYGNVPPQSEWTREDYAYMEAARWQYGRGAWRSLWRYVWWREMWGNEPFTAMPMTVPVGRRKSE